MINLRTWYYLLLLIPDLVPSVLWMSSVLTEPTTEVETYSLMGTLYYAVTYWVNNASIPYLGFAGLTIFFSWNYSPHKLQIKSWKLPLFFAPAFLPFFYWTNHLVSLYYSNTPPFAFFIMLIAIAIGYFYVLLAHVMTWVLQKIRIIPEI